MSRPVNHGKNVPDWLPSENNYQLVFCDVDGVFRECGHDIPKYRDMILSDYFNEMHLVVPDYCQFMRVLHPDYLLEYRAFGGRIRIDYKKREIESMYF